MPLRNYKPGAFPQLYNDESLRRYLTDEFNKISTSFASLDGTGSGSGADSVGDYLGSEVLSTAAVSLTSTVAANVTSITLTAGDWDVWINGAILSALGTTVSAAEMSVSTASATIQSSPVSRRASIPIGSGQSLAGVSDAGYYSLNVGPTRLSVSVPTLVYFVAKGTWAGPGPLKAYGHLQARLRAT